LWQTESEAALKTLQKMIPALILLTCGPCAVHGQSIVVSGGHGSIVVSGQRSEPQKPMLVFAEEKPVQKATEPKPQPKLVEQPQPAVVRQVRQERYLISEIWCRYCPAAKAQFLRSGGKPENVITIAQARQMGYQNPKWTGGVPHEFTLETIVEVPVEAAKPTISPTVTQAAMPARYVMYGNQLIDLETYTGCSSRNCGMCRTLRAQQAAYRAAIQQQSAIDLPDHQQPTPHGVVNQIVNELQLSSSDVLADFGCGDGRILIAAVKQYGCRAIGVEIDPVRANEARRQVAQAGLTNSITIMTADALRFWPADHGVTAAVAYLYPDLLEKLRPQLEQVRVLVTPFHEVPGMNMERRGDVFVLDIRTGVRGLRG
jgi:protein-L-isoaspartate O-methyltransferase